MGKSQISGMWSNITFYCANHKNEKLIPKQGVHSVYYGCPHELDSPEPCHNRLNLIDADKAVQFLMDKLLSFQLDGNVINLTNFTWTQNGITYKVLHHNTINEHMSILVDNKKIMQNR